VRDGAVTGLRIDHVDGLSDPFGYLARLRAAVGPDVPIWVEKILGPGESLPSEWPVQGTTGYEFASAANDVLLDADGLERLGKIARDHTRRDDPFVDVVAAKKRQVMDELFSGQVRRIVETARRALGRGAPAEPALAEAFVELTARLPVYRTYIRDRTISNEDRRIIGAAARDAKRHLSGA